MIAFPEMLRPAAERAGISVPADTDNYEAEKFPHWHVFVAAQIGTSMPYAGCHWDNAKAIASIPADRIMHVTPRDLTAAGFFAGFPIP